MMPYLTTAHQWLTQSSLLLQAQPISTRITLKYNLPTSNSHNTNHVKNASRSPAPKVELSKTSCTRPSQPLATLTLKTYDPTSGTTLKYRTNKGAEVGRLIQLVGRLSKGMTGLPMDDVTTADTVMTEKTDDIKATLDTKNTKIGGRKGKRKDGR
ncbi:BgTH12-07072 [Blumeria graminis f. sp. triticale]|uniref:BgtA-20057 n=3 Tax=Blumeria graminis TaxID=34373 RepID=A0A9X9MP67_BLUGR|nr:hypothetical protein BGT96224_A20057 [Blumeria graminis f. sp. tritici 96224]CAD6506142.1 BgTH12-07072 [Blumeria graminis f. sp. triticale]VDB94837.1 BgtA-20057 [Blumeria graminis f. sp. tritici]